MLAPNLGHSGTILKERKASQWEEGQIRTDEVRNKRGRIRRSRKNVGGIFADFVAARGGGGGWSILLFCGRGMVGKVPSEFVNAKEQSVVSRVFSDFCSREEEVAR